MSEHHLKIMRQPFLDLQSGIKTGEVRNCADREFQVGETVVLNLVDETGSPTGRSLLRSITHIQRGYGLPDDLCVLSYAQPNTCTKDGGQCGLGGYCEPCHSTDPAVQKYDDTLLPFFALMRKELHANAGKGDRPGWLKMSEDTCLLEVIYHFGKLQKAVKKGDGDGMKEYAADVANMCMMLLDICGALNLVEDSANGDAAQVPVALPKRILGQMHDDPIAEAQQYGWNACLDEFKRLNPTL